MWASYLLWPQRPDFGYSQGVKPSPHADPDALLGLLRELGRLDVGLLVRDLNSQAAVETLRIVQQQVEAVLSRALGWRQDTLATVNGLERSVLEHWPRAEAAQVLGALARTREMLIRVDQALGPALGLYQEIQRRCQRGEVAPRPRTPAESNAAPAPDSPGAAVDRGEPIPGPASRGADRAAPERR